MKSWKLLLVAALLLLLVLLLLPKFRFLVFLSPQGRINPDSLTGEFDDANKEAYYDNRPVSQPPFAGDRIYENFVLGEGSGQKRIEIDLTNQRIYAFEGTQKIYDFAISSGKWGRTPTGTFHIWVKLRYVLMTGGSKLINTYYYLPNVPYTMFFYNDEFPKWLGFGVHGTYWHDNFGHPMSHGCINMKTEEAELLYYWALPDLQGKQSIYASNNNPGTEVVIYGEAPME